MGKDIDFAEMKNMLKNYKKCILLDVRSLQEYKEGHLNNSINIPLFELSKKVSKIITNKDDMIIVYCQTGSRSRRAVSILTKLGYKDLYNLKGGLDSN